MKLSIITINYNNKAGLQKTIDSVICQTWKDYEWIVIDGGSTDGSKELIEQYQQHFAYWCSEPDKGVYNAMNKGIAKARGEYLNFMNSGDCFAEANVLERLFTCGYNEDVITGQVLRKDNHQLLRKCDENIVRQIFRDTLSHQGSFIKRTLFVNYSYREDYRIVSDWIAWMEWLLKSNHTFRYVETVVAVQDMQGISNEQTETLLSERRRAMQEYLGERLGEELSRLYKSESYLQGELHIPAIKMIRYLYYNAPKWFSVLYRVILFTVKIKDLLSHKTSYNNFSLER